MTSAPSIVPELALPALVRDLRLGAAPATQFLPPPAGMAELATRARQIVAEGIDAAERERRAAVAAALTSRQRRWNLAVPAALEAWIDGKAVTLVTGQQVGLLGGPLYTLYKMCAVRAAARDLERSGIVAVPIFWMVGDDHDFDEVRRGRLWTPEQLFDIELPAGRDVLSAVGGRSLGDAAERLRDELAAAFAATPRAAQALAVLRGGTTFTDAFVEAATLLLEGRDLVFADPLDPGLKQTALPLLARMAELQMELGGAWSETEARLIAAGYVPQVRIAADGTQLFWMDEQGRRRLRASPERAMLRLGDEEPQTLAEWVGRVTTESAALSPGVLLRPILQDHLLAPAAVILGPAEYAYMAQARPGYALLGVREPMWMLRPSAWLLEPRAARILEKSGLTIADAAGVPPTVAAAGGDFQPQALDGAGGQAGDPLALDAQAAIAALRNRLEEDLAKLAASLGALDSTLEEAARTAGRKMQHQVTALEDKLGRAIAGRDHIRLERLGYLQRALYPAGDAQERGVLALSYWLRHPDLAGLLEERLLPGAAPQIIELPGVIPLDGREGGSKH